MVSVYSCVEVSCRVRSVYIAVEVSCRVLSVCMAVWRCPVGYGQCICLCGGVL